MALYDEYQPYRNARFTEKEKARIDWAMYHDELMPGELKEVPGGFYNRNGDRLASFQVSALVQVHMEIALNRAQAQFRDLPIMPEDEDISLRYPGIDPVGKFSVIDMKFAQREANIRARLEGMSGPLKEAITSLLDNVRGEGGGAPFTYEGISGVRGIVEKHRELTRASKLCLDPFGRQLLHQQARELETCKDVVGYDQDLQLLEYACGLRRGPVPKELIEHEKDSRILRFPFNEALAGKKIDEIIEMGQQGVDLAHPPKEIHLEFQNLEHKTLQKAFSSPANWGKSLEQLQEAADWLMGPDQPDIMTPYARATADRVLNSLFGEVEQNTNKTVSRGDLIIIDGKTVRERMFADYMKAGNSVSEFHKFYQKNVNRLTGEYVAAGLMAGKRVETFVPDANGNIPEESSQVLGAGYQPSPLKPEHFNAWQRFFSRLGFYKEKVARQQLYEQTLAARERVKATNISARWKATSGTNPTVKEPFIGGWLREHNGALGFTSKFSVTRSALHSFSVAKMLMDGHSVEDILDPTKLREEKDAVGREVIEHLSAPEDLEWAGNVVFNGLRLIGNEIDRMSANLDFADEKQIFGQKTLYEIARIGFDLSQERDHCAEETLAASAAYVRDNHMEGDPKTYLDEIHNGVDAVGTFLDYGCKAIGFRPYMEGGMMEAPAGGFTEIMGDLATFEDFKRKFAGFKAADPAKGATKYFPTIEALLPVATVSGALENSNTFMDLKQVAEKDKTGEFQRGLGKEIMSGRFQERMQIDDRFLEGHFSFEIDPPQKEGDMELRTPKQIKEAAQAAKQQKAAQKQQPPQMGGPRL